MKGLVFGKFYPFHVGHQRLIEFALTHCNQLHVLVCATASETISGTLRQQWISETFANQPNIVIDLLEYDEQLLPNSSESSREISALWTNKFLALYPNLDIVFTSEPYGEFVADFMQIKHLLYDQERVYNPINATLIRNNPYQYWEYIPKTVRPYFVKKVVILGTESTGKTTLSRQLASHFNTIVVPELGRAIVSQSKECTFDDLEKIATAHAQAIDQLIPKANKLLFIDTDIHITQSYSQFLFGKTLQVPKQIMDSNKASLYLYLENDVAFVQDGTRLDEIQRNQLHENHLLTLRQAGIHVVNISGNWTNRLSTAIKLSKQLIEN